MKKSGKVSLITILFICALLIVSGMASRDSVASINSGDIIFVGETGLDISGVSPDITSFVHYEPFPDTPDKIVEVTNVSNFDMLASAIGDTEGVYYAWNAQGLIEPYSYVIIKYPDINLDIRINGTLNSVNGKNVTESQNLIFKLTNNIGPAFTAPNIRPDTQNCSIEISTPGGGKIRKIGSADFSNISLYLADHYSDPFTLEGYGPGIYSAIVKFPSTSDLYGVSSNTVFWEVSASGSVHNLNTGENFTSIQAAIDSNNTLSGHVIQVENGVYFENINVHKSLHLKGEGYPAIDGLKLDHTVVLSSSNVIIEGFEIINSSPQKYGISCIDVLDNIIRNNIIRDNNLGIFVEFSVRNAISGNRIFNNLGTGIVLSHCVEYTSIVNNSIHGNLIGINASYCSNNAIYQNTIQNNTQYGITSLFASTTSIYDNYFSNKFNALSDNNSTWNITKTPGTNIIGGDWIGGNYWSDYTGFDINSDGIGDTQLPYNASGNITNSGDWLPLTTHQPAGEVTISATGELVRAIGEEIVLSGYNAASSETYLFLIGPNLPIYGSSLWDFNPVITNDTETFTVVDVDADNTWNYTWQAVGLELEPGNYTVYAVSEPRNLEDIVGIPNASITVELVDPTLSATTSTSELMQGEQLVINGTATGDPFMIAFWILGTNYGFHEYESAVNGSFSYQMSTQDLSEGQYSVIVQHPNKNALFDAYLNWSDDRIVEDRFGNYFVFRGPGSLQSDEAAAALIHMLNTSGDDLYSVLTFIVTDPDPPIGDVPGSSVTISAPGNHKYYLGDNITLSGSNFVNNTVYLSIVGSNLPVPGGRLEDPQTAVQNGNPSTFTVIDVATTSWQYTWNTAYVDLDGILPNGTRYTIIAAAEPKAAYELDTTEYAAVTVDLLTPFISETNSPTIAKGDNVTIRGHATGSPYFVAIWIIGTDLRLYVLEYVAPDGSFQFNLTDTIALASGDYYVITQHPMLNALLDVYAVDDTFRMLVEDRIGNSFIFAGEGSLGAIETRDSLIEMLRNPYIDEVYTKSMFVLEDPWIAIDPVANATAGDIVNITGTTNLARDDTINVEIISQSTNSTVASGMAEILPGNIPYTWKYEVDMASFPSDDYYVFVYSGAPYASANSSFSILDPGTGSEPILELHFDEGTGTVAYDSSGYGNNGTIYGATWVDGISGKALDFNGTTDYVDLGNLGLSTSSGTIETWIYPRTIGCCKQIFSARSGDNQNNVQFLLTGTTDLGFYIAQNGSPIVEIYNPLTANRWHHVVVTQDGVTSRMFIDGVLQEDFDSGEWFDDVYGLNEYAIGRMRWMSNYYFDGIIDEFALYSRALSSYEVQTQYLLHADNLTQAPVADFTAYPLYGDAPLNVSFTDLSSGYPTAWNWSFGDGNTSTAQHPVHTYTVAGNYSVSLTVSNGTANDTVTKEQYIQVEPLFPNAQLIFNVNYNRGTTNDSIANGTSLGRLVYFTGVSNPIENQESISGNLSFILDAPSIIALIPDTFAELNGTQVTWQFPPSTTINPGATLSTTARTSVLTPQTSGVTLERICNRTTFAEAGEQLVTLHMTFATVDLDGLWGRIECSETADVRPAFIPGTLSTDLPLLIITEESGRIQFAINHSQIETGRQYTISYALVVDPLWPVTYAPSCAIWEVTDATSATASSGTAVSIPASLLPENVSAVAFSSDTPCQWLYSRHDHIVTSISQRAALIPALVANFTANVTSGTAPLGVQFTDTSAGEPDEWFWDFGDGTNSSERNPVHTYDYPTISVDSSPGRVIQPGDILFVHEKNVNLQPLRYNSSVPITELRNFIDGPGSELQNLIVVGDDSNFTLDVSDVGGISGLYYPFDAHGNMQSAFTVNLTVTNSAGSDTRTESDYIILDSEPITINQPDIALDVVLNESRSDSVNGLTITTQNEIAFKISSPVGAYYRENNISTAQVEIRVTTPGGSTTTYLGGMDLSGINLTEYDVFMGGIPLNIAENGTFTAQARWVMPDGFAESAPDSNYATFTVLRSPVNLTANKQTVVRGDPFTITINGERSADYYVFIMNEDLQYADQYPSMTPDQPGAILGNDTDNFDGATFFSLAGAEYPQSPEPGSLAPGTEWNAWEQGEVDYAIAQVTTSAAGMRTIEFITSDLTAPGTYSIKVVDLNALTLYDILNVSVFEQTGSIEVNSVPAGAWIWIDGINQSVQTNTTLADIPVGSHTVAVTLEGYVDPVPQIVEVVNATTETVTFTLSQETGSIEVISVPAGAWIWIDGINQSVQTNATLADIPVGSHAVAVTLDGYVDPAPQIVEVVNATTEIVSFTLAEQLGSIEVNSVPAGAWIWIDGINQSVQTNTTLTDIQVGSHSVGITLDGYVDPVPQSVEVVNATTETVSFTLSQETGSIEVISVPAGAWIWLDGINQTVQTNTTLADIPVGSHSVGITLDGYVDPVPQIVEVVNATTETVSFTLAEQTGSVEVRSVPTGAWIWLDGINQSVQTNTTLTDIPVGNYSVGVTLDGYVDPITQIIEVINATTETVTFILAEQTGSIKVNSYPAGAWIWINGINQTVQTNATVADVPVGSHSVGITLDGYVDPVPQIVEVVNASTETVSFTLGEQTGSIEVNSVPAGAWIWIDGINQTVQTNTTLADIPVGSHAVAITLEGYVDPAPQIVEVVNATTETITFTLSQETGSIEVNSVPSGAWIWLDGINLTVQTNTTLTDIPVGSHAVAVSLEGYVDPVPQIVEAVNATTETVSFTLAEQLGSIEVNSVPAGAWIWLDGINQTAQTNTTLTDIPVGSHTVAITLEGYVDPVPQIVEVVNATTETVTFTLSQETGSIEVISVPAGAWIWLDGINQSVQTNTTLADIPVGSHTVAIQLDGYIDPVPQIVEVVNATTETVTFILAEQTGSIEVNSVPSGAWIWIDGINQTVQTNTTLADIPVGSHSVGVTLDGYVDPVPQTVEVVNATTETVSFMLSQETGIIEVNSVPAGAWIWIDGINQTVQTNTTLVDIPVGSHAVAVSLEGYVDPVPQTVEVVNATTETVSFTLAEQTGSVEVNSYPAGAWIWLDGNNQSVQTNTTLTDIPVGSHTVAVQLSGYVDPVPQSVEVVNATTEAVTFTLSQETGSIEVNSVPAGAWIWLDGNNQSVQTNTTLADIPVGLYSVAVTKEGYLDSLPQEVTVVNSTITPLVFVLDGIPNDAPIASNDTYSIQQDTALHIVAPGVLANDLDMNEDNITAAIESSVQNGSLTFHQNGSFSYIPDAGFNGEDSFTYTANDGELNSGPATVTIIVEPAVDETGWFIVHSNVDGASVYFDETFMGVCESGDLVVEVNLTATPYQTYTVQIPGYVPYTGLIETYPPKNGTTDLYAKLYAGYETVDFSVPGVSVSEVNGAQYISINTSQLSPETVLIDGTDVILSDPTLGFQQITFHLVEMVDTGDQISGYLSGSDMTSGTISADIFGFGTVTPYIEMNLTSIPADGQIDIGILDDEAADEASVFYGFADATGTPIESFEYVIEVKTINLETAIDDAFIYFTAPRSWVDSYGSEDIRIFRRDDAGTVTVLETTVIAITETDVTFRGYSPDGFSTFALVAITPPAPTPTPAATPRPGRDSPPRPPAPVPEEPPVLEPEFLPEPLPEPIQEPVFEQLPPEIPEEEILTITEVLSAPAELLAAELEHVTSISSEEYFTGLASSVEVATSTHHDTNPIAAAVPDEVAPIAAVATGIGVAGLGAALGGSAAAATLQGGLAGGTAGGSSGFSGSGSGTSGLRITPRITSFAQRLAARSPTLSSQVSRLHEISQSSIRRVGDKTLRNPWFLRRWEKFWEFTRKLLGFEAIGLAGVKEIQWRQILPKTHETVFAGLSIRELGVVAISVVLFAVAFMFAGRLEVFFRDIVLFILMGALAVIGHEVITNAIARQNNCESEFQLWGLGSLIMFINAGLFGMTFGKPSRTIVASAHTLSPRERGTLMLIGPLVNVIFALISLYLIPFGGIIGAAGAVGFPINIMLGVYTLIPIHPMKGKVIYQWNRLIWAVFFIPLVMLYIAVYFIF